MSDALPAPIAAYFAADAVDGTAIAHCFTEDATVTDDGETHTGRAAIAAWKTATTAAFAYTIEPIASTEADGKTFVSALVIGNFPGSPITLTYIFTLAGDKITALEITTQARPGTGAIWLAIARVTGTPGPARPLAARKAGGRVRGAPAARIHRRG